MWDSKKTWVRMLAIVSLLLWGVAQAQESTPPDTTKEGYPYYKNVDVEINYGWGDPEMLKGVNAIVKLEKKIPVAVIVEHRNGSKVEAFLRYEVVVRIYDRQTGKLLRTLQAHKVAS